MATILIQIQRAFLGTFNFETCENCGYVIVFFFRFVAVSVVDMEFLAIDFNPCPPSDGNDPPNYFYNTARCKPSTIVSLLTLQFITAINTNKKKCLKPYEEICQSADETLCRSIISISFFVLLL